MTKEKLSELIKTNPESFDKEVLANLQEIVEVPYLNEKFLRELRDEDPVHYKALSQATRDAIEIFLGN